MYLSHIIILPCIYHSQLLYIVFIRHSYFMWCLSDAVIARCICQTQLLYVLFIRRNYCTLHLSQPIIVRCFYHNQLLYVVFITTNYCTLYYLNNSHQVLSVAASYRPLLNSILRVFYVLIMSHGRHIDRTHAS